MDVVVRRLQNFGHIVYLAEGKHDTCKPFVFHHKNIYGI